MISNVRFLTLYALLGVTAFYLLSHNDLAVPMNRPFSAFPTSIKGWRMVSEARFSENVLNILKPTDYLSRRYAAPDGRPVNLYLGYHGGGKGSGGIHSPKHCLPGSGWYEVSSGQTTIGLEGTHMKLVRAVYQKGDERELFLYWFQVRDDCLSDEYSLKFAEILNSLLHRRRDSTFVRVSVPFETDEKGAMEVGCAFIRDARPVINEFLPK
jgi:EpsI family protein